MTAQINGESILITKVAKVDLLHAGEAFSAVGVWLPDKIAVIHYATAKQAQENFRMLKIAITHYR